MKGLKKLPPQGWIGLVLVVVFWILNWGLHGLRTQWAFFPLWLGYCLTIDGLVFWRTGTSLLARSWKKYIGLFLTSAPVWWLFELANSCLQNWHYNGAESFSLFMFWVWATLNFTTVIPAVLGSAELMRSFIKQPIKGPVISPTKATTLGFFLAGWVMLFVMVVWPKIFFPFVWVSFYFILEPITSGWATGRWWSGPGMATGARWLRYGWVSCLPLFSGNCGIFIPTQNGSTMSPGVTGCMFLRCLFWATAVTCPSRLNSLPCTISSWGWSGRRKPIM